MQRVINQLPEDFVADLLGPHSSNQDLEVFCSPLGQVFLYWLYQALNFDLAATNETQIAQINNVKKVFAGSLGDPKVRAEEFRTKLIDSGAGIIFTQESDAILPEVLLRDGLFLPVDRQNSLDGTLVFLRSDLWQSDYEVVNIENYEGFQKGRMNVVLGTLAQNGERFLLASGHGNSTRSEDGRLQISLIMEKFRKLSALPENAGLQLVIGIDANTKNQEDEILLREHLYDLGLVAMSVGPTTIKRRMVTTQHSKAGRFAVDEEDYLITLKSDHEGRFIFSDITVGFKLERPDIAITLPNCDNPSDHYPVGARLVPYLKPHQRF